MSIRSLMLQGTGSSVGKSLLATGLCRLLNRYGLNVAPFKPQNMSNNAAVTLSGGEISRAQALQAQACRAIPSVHMNPVLLKPQGNKCSQLVVLGESWGKISATDYQSLKLSLLPSILMSFQTLSSQADLIIVEGAGAASETNLRTADIANMGFAEAADVPVILIGDIDRGGVIASLVGTHALLSATERSRVKGVLINKFRGDIELFSSGLDLITKKTGWQCLGVVPWFTSAHCLPAEDSASLPDYRLAEKDNTKENPIHIAVLQLPNLSNFDDFDPLQAEPDVILSFVTSGMALKGNTDVVILPGSKATLADLAFLRKEGWDIDIAAHLHRGGMVLGLCAGYQMLGRVISDPKGIEGSPGSGIGLGLLDVETVITGTKTLRTVRASDLFSKEQLYGYEIHMGKTDGPDQLERPWLKMEDGSLEGACSVNRQVRGCYIHGLFLADSFRQAFLSSLRPKREKTLATFPNMLETNLELLADHLELYTDVSTMLSIAQSKL